MKNIKNLTLAACMLVLGTSAFAQQEEDRKVTIDVEVEENGETRQVKKEVYLKEGQTLNEALNELGILDELGNIKVDERVEIDIRRMFDDVQKDMQLRFYHNDGNGMLFGQCEPKAQLGVMLDTESGAGACITKVLEGTPAEAAGLAVGDCIVQFNDETISNASMLIDAVSEAEIGSDAVIKYTRGGKSKSTTATLAQAENSAALMWKGNRLPVTRYFEDKDADATWSQAPRPFLGVQGNSETNGLRVTRVVPNSAAVEAGIQEGDLIREVNNEPVNSIEDLADMLNGMAVGDEVDLNITRDGKRIKVTAALGKRNTTNDTQHFHFDTGNQDYSFDFDIDQIEKNGDWDINIEGLNPDQQAEFDEAMKQLQEAMKGLQEKVGTWEKDNAREMRVIITATDLSTEDRQMLQRAGVEDLNRTLDVDLDLFPNPSNGLFQVRMETPARGNLSIEVYNEQGGQVYMERLIDYEGPYEGRIDLSSRAAGNYFLVISHNGRTLARKLTKQ